MIFDPYGEKPFVEVAARQALRILSDAGLKLGFFTVTIRNRKYSFEPKHPPEVCHLRVQHPDPGMRSLTITEKKLKDLGRDMECFGDVEGTQFYNLVEKKTGHPYRLRDRSAEFWQQNLM